MQHIVKSYYKFKNIGWKKHKFLIVASIKNNSKLKKILLSFFVFKLEKRWPFEYI